MTLRTETVLDDLVAGVREDLTADRAARPEGELRARLADVSPARGLYGALRRPEEGGGGRKGDRLRVIAEVKKASPSAGTIAGAFAPAAIAARYAAGGAAAVSVLTERRRFQGHLDHLREVRAAVALPVLRKEFIFDPYQILEAREAGADAVLLIAAILDEAEMADLRALAEEMGMDALVEVYTAEEMERALASGARILGVNNRDLRTFETDPARTGRLIGQIPPERRRGLVLVSESGIFGWKEAAPLAEAGVDAILVGESLMRAESPESLLRELRGLSGD
ncbi:MAG: indole-3-glycerol phosphate synthase TrpC [bacterium]